MKHIPYQIIDFRSQINEYTCTNVVTIRHPLELFSLNVMFRMVDLMTASNCLLWFTTRVPFQKSVAINKRSVEQYLNIVCVRGITLSKPFGRIQCKISIKYMMSTPS